MNDDNNNKNNDNQKKKGRVKKLVKVKKRKPRDPKIVDRLTEIHRRDVRQLRDDETFIPKWCEKGKRFKRNAKSYIFPDEGKTKKNMVGDNPAMFLVKDILLKTDYLSPPRKGFADNFDILGKAYDGVAHTSLGTCNLTDICSILVDGWIITHYCGTLGPQEESGVLKNVHSGHHGPFYVFFNEKKLAKFIKEDSARARAKFYPVKCIEHIAVPDEKQQAFVWEVLQTSLKFITAKEYKIAAEKVLTYQDVAIKLHQPREAVGAVKFVEKKSSSESKTKKKRGDVKVVASSGGHRLAKKFERTEYELVEKGAKKKKKKKQRRGANNDDT